MATENKSTEGQPVEGQQPEEKPLIDSSKNISKLNETFLNIFAYNNSNAINKIISSPNNEIIRQESRGLKFDDVFDEVFTKKLENFTKGLKRNNIEQEIARLERDIEVLKVIGAIAPEKQKKIDVDYATKQGTLLTEQKNMQMYQSQLMDPELKQKVFESTKNSKELDPLIYLRRLYKEEYRLDMNNQAKELKEKDDKVNELRTERTSLKNHNKKVLGQKVKSAQEKVNQIEDIQKDLRVQLTNAGVIVEQLVPVPQPPIQRAESFTKFAGTLNDSPAVLVSKWQGIDAIKEGYKTEIAEIKGLIAYSEKVDTEIIKPILEKAEQAKETTAPSQTTQEATIASPKVEREPTPIIVEEPKKEASKDQIDRPVAEKPPHPIDVNAIVKEPTPELPKKPVVEEPKKEPVVTENLDSKKAELAQAYIENLQSKEELLKARIKNYEELLKRARKSDRISPEQHAGIKQRLENDKLTLNAIQINLSDPAKTQEMMKDLPTKSIKQMDADIKSLQEETRGIKEQTKELNGLDHSKLKQSFFRNSHKIRAARWLLNLWPIAMLPFGMSWISSILPSTSLAIFGQQFLNAIVGFVAASFFGSKAIIYAKKKIPQLFNKLVQKYPKVFGPIARGLTIARQKFREKMPFVKQKQPAEQTKDATPVNEKLVEGIEKSEVTKEGIDSKEQKGKEKVVTMEAPTKDGVTKEGATKEGPNTVEIEEKQSRLKRAWEYTKRAPKRAFDYVMKNKMSLFIMLAVPLALGVGGMFAVAALVPALATTMAAPFLLQLGAVALIGVAIGIGVQLLDKFVFKRIESKVAKKENLEHAEKINERGLDVQEKGKCVTLDSKEFRDKVTAIAGLDEKAKAPEHVQTNEQQKTTERSERTSEITKDSKVIEMKPRESNQPQPSTSQAKVDPTPSGSKESVTLTNRGNPTIERRASFPGTIPNERRQASFEVVRRNSLDMSAQRNSLARTQQAQNQAKVQNNKKTRTTQL
ncbi:hypothetical protein JZO83_11135 [Enterococcus sp. DIV1298c]|uniref:hypothetical protein n=1 Tax=Enterococcus sp. DIV1298c TaxID=2815328 RepID=UPI001A920E51|nr:hypothetical protein [Enterococcus sp. DIV1298c]MBO0462313.1 hypothetical protein [Enterococcus sp. DIV1298c]